MNVTRVKLHTQTTHKFGLWKIGLKDFSENGGGKIIKEGKKGKKGGTNLRITK